MYIYNIIFITHFCVQGGQSATGALLDHVITTHPAAAQLRETAERKGRSIYEVLNDSVNALARDRGLAFPALLTRDLHVFPDFHGNRY
jgi:ribulose kinase